MRAGTSGTTDTFTFVVIATNVDDHTSKTYNFPYDHYVDGSTVDAVIESITDGGRYTLLLHQVMSLVVPLLLYQILSVL